MEGAHLQEEIFIDGSVCLCVSVAHCHISHFLSQISTFHKSFVPAITERARVLIRQSNWDRAVEVVRQALTMVSLPLYLFIFFSPSYIHVCGVSLGTQQH